MPLERRAQLSIGLSSRLESFAPVLLAQHLGEFEKENLEVELEFLPTTESTLLVAQGKLDAAVAAFSAGVFNLVAAGSPIKFVFPGVSQPEGSTQGFWINNDVLGVEGGAVTVDAFKGQKILTSSGDASPSAFQLFSYLKGLPGGEELDAKDLSFEAFPATDAASALISGAAGVAQVNSPHDLELARDGCCTFLEGVVPPGRTVSGYFLGPSMTGRADVGAALVRSLARATLTYLPANYREDATTMKALAEVLDLELSMLKELPPLYWSPTFETDAEANLEEGQEFYRDRGLLRYDGDLDVQDLWDTRYLEAIRVRQK